MKRTISLGVIAALGFFALAAQTLLFRDFFAAFESNEIAIGAFFASWLLWICAGALAGRFETRLHGWLARRLPAVALVYVPAFFAQQALMIQARELAGVAAYDVFPLLPMLGMAFIVNAPVSFTTGFLFTLACRWAEDHAEIPVARVYVLETLGSCAGGLFVTAAIAGGMAAESAAVWAVAVLAAAAILPYVSGGPFNTRRAGAAVLAGLLVLAAIHGGAGRSLAGHRARSAWARLLPADEYEGAFVTAHAKYLYGRREGQLNVVAGGGVSDSLPPGDHAAEVAAVHMAQRPETRSALVIGPGGLGICLSLLELPQVERVAWHHPDPRYPEHLIGLLQGELKRRAERVQLLPKDPTRPDGSRNDQARYDLIILNVPDITTLALNRYVTQRYYGELKKLLSEGGAVSVRVSGGENYMGGELVLQGSSMMFTLGRVFKEVTIKPGDETWVMGSDVPFLYYPNGLKEQFAALEGAAKLYPPENIAVLYGAGPVAFQMQAYREQIEQSGEKVLLNTDAVPKAPAYALLLAVKRAGLPSFASLMSTPRGGGVPTAAAAILASGILIYGLLRLVYLLKQRRGGAPGTFDSHALVFTTGLAGMAAGVVLMFAYQSRFGSLFLDIGLVSALFMAGAFAGGLVSERALVAAPGRARQLLVAVILVHAAILAALPKLTGWELRPAWAAAFFVCGAFTGLYFPYAAHVLKSAGKPSGAAGSNLELLDSLGGAAGAAVAGLIMLPLLGLVWTSLLFAALVAVNVVGAALGGGHCANAGAPGFDRWARVAGYTLAGVAVFSLIASHVVAGAVQPDGLDALQAAANELVGDAPVEQAQGELADGTAVSYLAVEGLEDSGGGYVFSTKPWAGGIHAFAGKFELAVLVDGSGALQEYEVISSDETPMYLSMVRDADSRLQGRNLFQPGPFAGVDGVVGATATDEAFREALATAGQGFARDVLHATGGASAPVKRPVETGWAWRNFLVLAAFLGGAILLSYYPRPWLRRGYLVAAVVVLGFWLNLQYSTQQVLALLTGRFGTPGFNAPFFLLAVVPLAALLLGNLYCGYLCPFGALQELATDLGGRLKTLRQPRPAVWKLGRSAKYVVLFGLLVLYAVRRDVNVLTADPLVGFFGAWPQKSVAVLAFGGIGLSLVFGRFWCRNLCPAGAFLALMNGVRLNGPRVLRRLAPFRLPARCDLGVQSPKDLDCICCDRCRGRGKPAASDARGSLEHDYAFSLAAAAMLVAVAALTLAGPQPRAHAPAPAPQAEAAAGQPRDVDIEEVRDLVKKGLLSDHPAEFASPAP